MTFAARETSLANGQPVRLYEFQRGLIRFRYTNSDRQFEFQTQTFTPEAISDDGPKQSGQTQEDALTITGPNTLPVARMFRGSPPSTDIMVIVRDTHIGETEARVKWVGTLASVRFPSPERCELKCLSLQALFDQPGLRVGWERGCPWAVYDHNCTLNPVTFRTTATVQSMTGASISSGTFDALADGWFNGGYVEWDVGFGEMDRRGVETHVGSVLTLLGGTDGIALGQEVRAYPGCARTIQVCNDKFNNVPNYGGIPHLPGKSPFDGDPVF